MPTPQSLIDIMTKYGFADRLIREGLASDVQEAAWKAKVCAAIIPMIAIFFATEAIPLAATALLIGVVLYFFRIIPMPMIATGYQRDAVMFILGILAMGVAVSRTGLDRRILMLMLGKSSGNLRSVTFMLCIGVACLASFFSEHAIVAFLVPVTMLMYATSISAAGVKEDPKLAKMLLLTLCFAANSGGPGAPSAGARNAIMMGFFQDYGIPISYAQWMMYGFPYVPVMATVIAFYLLTVMRPAVTNLKPGLDLVKNQLKEKGPMSRNEKIMAAIMVTWIGACVIGSEEIGLGGPSMLAIVAILIFRLVRWDDLVRGIAWDAWLIYAGACALGVALFHTGAALWLASSFLNLLAPIGLTSGIYLAIGVSLFVGLLTNFIADGATVAVTGPVAIPMGVMTMTHPWMVGLAVSFSSSFANFLVVGTPNNAIAYSMGRYSDGRRVLSTIDFLKYGVLVTVLNWLVLWAVIFFGWWSVVSFPEFNFEAALKEIAVPTEAKGL